MPAFLKTVAAITGIPFALSFAGAWLSAGDSFAVFRMPLAVVFALSMIWTPWPRRVRWPLTVIVIAALAQVAWWKQDRQSAGGLVLYQRNLWAGNSGTDALLSEIRNLQPDVITLQEVSRHNRALLEQLRPDYPRQVHCASPGRWGIAVLARRDYLQSGTVCSEPLGLAGLRLDTPTGALWVLSVHLKWPWPYGQRAQLAPFSDIIASRDAPVVLAGDFNMVPWGHGVRSLRDAAQGRLTGPLTPTLLLGASKWPVPVPLPIDHVIAPGGGRHQVLARSGSDHNGLLARVHIHED